MPSVWVLPTVGQLNSDATVDVVVRKIGIGIVIHDHSGFVMVSCFQKVDASYSLVVAEAVAIFLDLRFTMDSGLGFVVVESDVAVVVSHANASMSICVYMGLIIRDIKEFSYTFCLSVSHVPRQGNRVAHGLGKYAITFGED